MSSATTQCWRTAVIGLACIALTGCSYIRDLSRRTLITEPHAFYWKEDKQRSLATYSAWADEVWSEESRTCPQASSPDYSIGFRDGFVDYVYAGGNGEPPPIPPRHLWNVGFRNEEGRRRADDWYAGYRHGAQVAREGGFRELATLRTSILGLEPRKPGIYGEDWAETQYGANGEWPSTEPLPLPKNEPPSEEIESAPPAAKPVIPPPPHNLPPTTPGASRAPRNGGSERSPFDDDTAGPEPKTDSAPTTLDRVDPMPLSLPDDGTPEPRPAEQNATPERESSESKSSSLRILAPPTTAAHPTRTLASVQTAQSRLQPRTMTNRAPDSPERRELARWPDQRSI